MFTFLPWSWDRKNHQDKLAAVVSEAIYLARSARMIDATGAAARLAADVGAVDAILPWSTGSRHALPADLGAESMAVQANGYCCDGDTFTLTFKILQVDAGLIVLALY